ncbi:phospholipase A and acyltransferase 3-like [Bradysia coprophila]|uniref:phospholipase A and acyltransferase 3-like n=1 Tax=Bradysia coprophila TaxID=38358 RepID=UPI00187DCC2D|nr:phospholipase A and acyltransferase 3-like [Bradysia coprophila]
MGTLTSWTTAENLLKSISPCDIVEFNRITYSHFGFYIGDGICVHVQAPSNTSLGSSSRSSSSSSRRRLKEGYGTKVAEPLVKIAGHDFVRVNNSEVTAFQLGVNRRPEEEAKKLAVSGLPVNNNGNVIIGQSINVEYFLVSSNNCEGWSTYWRYNHPSGWSIQSTNAVFNSTIGTVERFTESIACCADSILADDNSPMYKKLSVGAAVVPYMGVKYTTKCVKNVTNFATGSLMRIFKQ